MQLWQWTSVRSAPRILALIALTVVAAVAAVAAYSPAPASAKSAHWLTFEATLTLNGDGTYHIVERQVVEFEDGPFTFAFSSIPLAESD